MNTHKDSVKAEVQICKQLGTEPWVTVYELQPTQLSWAIQDCRREMDWIKSTPAQYSNPQGIRYLVDGKVYESDLLNSEAQWTPVNNTVSSVQELQARIAATYPEHVALQEQREGKLERDFQPTFQKFSKELFMARAKQREWNANTTLRGNATLS